MNEEVKILKSVSENPGARLCCSRPAAARPRNLEQRTILTALGWSATQPRSFFRRTLTPNVLVEKMFHHSSFIIHTSSRDPQHHFRLVGNFGG
jgi:hypothetical protein